MLKLFTRHPQSVGETYGQHGCFALRTAAILLGSGCALIIHALFPWLFKDTASDNVCKLYTKLMERKRLTQSPNDTKETQ